MLEYPRTFFQDFCFSLRCPYNFFKTKAVELLSLESRYLLTMKHECQLGYHSLHSGGGGVGGGENQHKNRISKSKHGVDIKSRHHNSWSIYLDK